MQKFIDHILSQTYLYQLKKYATPWHVYLTMEVSGKYYLR